jgi:DNA-binding transcriptional MerR regulator
MAARLTIGRLLELLADEFPDLTPSKVRFLESEGLITPGRTPAGYRTYGDEDIERLRYILAAQRDRFWPLRVIREALDARDRGLGEADDRTGLPRPRQPAPDPDVPSADELTIGRTVALTGPELRASTGLDRATFEALESFGLIEPTATGHYDDRALGVAAAASRLAEYGLEPRHLRPFRTAAEREVGLVEQVLAGRRGERGGTRRRAEMLSACIALHVALVKAGLDR